MRLRQSLSPSQFDQNALFSAPSPNVPASRAPTASMSYVLALPDLRCGACVAKIERALSQEPEVASARVNLTLKQLRVSFHATPPDLSSLRDRLAALGFSSHPLEHTSAAKTQAGDHLLRRVAVAGFGAMNIMLLSVGVWSGAEGQTRQVFHIISALIAVPVVFYTAQPFFKSAYAALRMRRLNMDVPIALAVTLAMMMSLFELSRQGEEVFFDATVTLLSFLLAGRYLDQIMRERARTAVNGLAKLFPKSARVRRDGDEIFVPLDDVQTGDILIVDTDEPIAVDAQIQCGHTDIDRSLITGEALPVSAGPGDRIESGTINLTGQIEALALHPARDSFLAQMIRMQQDAEAGRGAYIRIADRAARLYAPVVHLLALVTFVFWYVYIGSDWQTATFIAISVLIITCPCALGLAVPVAHVVAAGQLLRNGILMKNGSALERLAEIDTALFDKTGTLTTGRPGLAPVTRDEADLSAARSLACRSNHPAARAISNDLPCIGMNGIAQNVEVLPGFGVSGMIEGRQARLGRAEWVAEITDKICPSGDTAFAIAGGNISTFPLIETIRPKAKDALAELSRQGLDLVLLSGDSASRVTAIAKDLGIPTIRHDLLPEDKIAYLEKMRFAGHSTLMVGDGLNDVAALAAAHVSMAPSSASDAGRTAADFVYLRDGLEPIPLAYRIAKKSARIVRQNFALAVTYNCIAIPLAITGYVTPLIAALAMSLSSILVIGNSLRLNRITAPHHSAKMEANA